MTIKQVFAQNLKDLRKKTGISQRTLAKKLGIQPTEVSAYERGVKLPTTVEKLIKIADFFDVPADKLFGRESDVLELWLEYKASVKTKGNMFVCDKCAKGINHPTEKGGDHE